MTSARRFTLFSFAWALAVLNHQNYHGRLVNLAPESLLDFVALWALLRPSSRGRLLLLAAAQLLTVVWEMPRVVNHWLLMGAVDLGLLLWLAPPFLRSRTLSDSALDAAGSMMRASLVVVYAFATIAKLNAGFFDPEWSCATQHYGWLTSTFPFLPDGEWTAWPAIVGTLLIEGTLAVGLAIRRTRVATLALGWAFHLALGWNAFYDFSMIAAALYTVFLPDSVFEGWDRTLLRVPWLGRLYGWLVGIGRSRLAFPILAAAMLGLGFLAPWLGVAPKIAHLRANAIGKDLFVVVWLAAGALAVVSLRLHGAATTGSSPSFVRHPALWVAVLVLTLNGFSPFLGLKTEHSYTMFSNVQTEGDRWNHYLYPRALRVFSFQDDLVRIHASSDPALARLARRDVRLVPFQLRTLVRENPEMSLRYEVGGHTFTAARAGNDPYLTQPISPWLDKLLLFRPVQPADANRCVH